MDDLRGEDQNGFFSIVLRHFHSTLCGYDFSGKESVFNNLDAFFLSLNEKRNCKKNTLNTLILTPLAKATYIVVRTSNLKSRDLHPYSNHI